MQSEILVRTLERNIETAKQSVTNPMNKLYEIKGRIDMAYQLEAISKEDYLKLSESCVREGINNPVFFNNLLHHQYLVNNGLL